MAQGMLEELVRLSEAMLSAARGGDFERLVRLECQRGRLLAGIPVLEASPLALAAVLRRIRDLDREVLTILERERDEAANALRELRRGRRAATAYAGSG